MRLQAALQAQLDVSPSPQGQHPVIFLLDADRRFDRNLLTQWINAHPDPDREHVIVCLDLRDDRNPLAVEALIDALQRHPQACVAPLRLSWLQADHAKKSGPRLRDVLRGGEGRPPSWLCDRVARLNPKRVHLTVGEPGATLDLADRFSLKPVFRPRRSARSSQYSSRARQRSYSILPSVISLGVVTKFPAMCIRAFAAIAPSSQACAPSRMRRNGPARESGLRLMSTSRR